MSIGTFLILAVSALLLVYLNVCAIEAREILGSEVRP